MPKNKRPVPRKPTSVPEEDEDVMAQALADLALEIARQQEPDRQRVDEFHKQLKNALRKKNDEVLYGAVERALESDRDAYRYLRGEVEEAAATLTIRRDGAPAMEIDAFLVPLFVRSIGGLDEAAGFRDDAAFAELVDSFRQAGLESAGARVVLISHAYDLGEIDALTYSQLNDMLRDAAASMGEKKIMPTPALERSIVGWTERGFAADDEALELRFLLGFSMKRADDPFYQAPAGEDAAQAYFDARMERYRQWTVRAAPLVKRCLAADPQTLDVSFLYQDLFFGAKQQGMDELAMLSMMSEVNQLLADKGLVAGELKASVAPLEAGGEVMVRVALYKGEQLVGEFEKVLDPAADVQDGVEDVRDALGTIGISRGP